VSIPPDDDPALMAPPRPDGTGDWLEAGATGGMGSLATFEGFVVDVVDVADEELDVQALELPPIVTTPLQASLSEESATKNRILVPGFKSVL